MFAVNLLFSSRPLIERLSGSYHMNHMNNLCSPSGRGYREKHPTGQKCQKHGATVKIEFDHVLRSPSRFSMLH